MAAGYGQDNGNDDILADLDGFSTGGRQGRP
jgi:hypothetical protein